MVETPQRSSHPRNMSFAERRRVRPIRNLLEFHKQHGKGGKLSLGLDYCRHVKGLSSLPKLKEFLELARQNGVWFVTDDFRRIFARCDRAVRPELYQEIIAYGNYLKDLRTGKSFSLLHETQVKSIVGHEGPVRFIFESDKPKGEPTPRGLDQVKNATKASAEIRGLKANKKAEQLKEVKAALTVEGKSPTLKGIAEEANARGLTTTRGNPWTTSTVQRVLKRLQP